MLLNFNDNASPFLIAFLNDIVGLFGNFFSILDKKNCAIIEEKCHLVANTFGL